MKKVIIAAIGIFCSTVCMAQTDYGANNLGKYTISLGVSYEQEVNLMLDFNYRAFNSLFARPLDMNVEFSIGVGVFSGKNSLTRVALSGSQVYANGNDINPGFGLGTGLGIVYDAKSEGDIDDKDLNLMVSLSPGYYAPQVSISPSVRYNFAEWDLDRSTDEQDNKVSMGRFLLFGLKSDILFSTYAADIRAYYNTLLIDQNEDASPTLELDEPGPRLRLLLGTTF